MKPWHRLTNLPVTQCGECHTCGECANFDPTPTGDEWGVCLEQTWENAHKKGFGAFVAWANVNDSVECENWEEA